MKKWSQILLFSLLGIVLLIFAIGYFYYTPDIPLEDLNKKYGIPADHYLQVDGMNVHYKAEGPASDTVPLVLLHGTSSSLYAWNAWTELLKNERRIIRLDLPGFGLTGPHPEEDYRIEAYLHLLQEFLNRLGVKQCILAGNSLGGEIAWRYTLNNPGQVQKLILIGAAGYPVETKELPLMKLPLSYLWLRIPLMRDLSVKFTTPQRIRNSLEFLYGDPERVSGKTVEVYLDMTLREGNREALANRAERIGEPAPWQRISSITTPSLIMWGALDRLIPVKHARQFHEDLPNSSLIIFPQAGHMPMEEIPEESILAVREFINSHATGLKKAQQNKDARPVVFLPQ